MRESWRPWILLFNVVLTSFMSIASATLTIIADNCVQGDLALSDSQISWVTILYFLGTNTMVLGANQLADLFGYRLMYVVGVGLFTLGSGLAGFADSFGCLGIARYIEGCGAGFIFPIGLALIEINFPKERLALALNIYLALAFGAGLGAGMPLSGFFAQFYSWRIPFFTMLPCGILSMLACWFLEKETPLKKGKFDLWGLISFTVFISSLLVALNNGQLPSTTYGWRASWIIGCFILAFIALLVTIRIESRHPNPAIPLVLFKDPIFSLSCISLFFLGMALFASLSLSSDYLINGLKTEKFMTGVICIVYGITMALSGLVANELMKKIPVPVLTLVGLGLLVISYFWNNILSWQTGWRDLIPILILRGIALGLALGPTTVQALRRVPAELGSAGATLLTFFRQVGGTFAGTAIVIFLIRRNVFHTARFGEQINTQLPGYKTTFMKLEALSTGDPNAATPLQVQKIIIENLERQSYIQSINDIFFIFAYITIAVGVLLFILNVFEWWKEKSALNHE